MHGLYFLEALAVWLSRPTRALQLMVCAFRPPVSSCFLPNSQRGSPPTPHLPAGRGYGCPSLSWGQLPCWGQLARQASRQAAKQGERTKGSGLGPTLSPKGRPWNVGHLSAPPSRPTPIQKASQQHPFPGGSSVHSHLCKRDGQDGARREVNCPQWWLWLWPTLQGVCAVRTGTPWAAATFQRDRLLGAPLRKACSSSSWRTRRSGEGGKLRAHSERWCEVAWSLLHTVSEVRFPGHPCAMCQEEGTVAQQHHGPSAWCVRRIQGP